MKEGQNQLKDPSNLRHQAGQKTPENARKQPAPSQEKRKNVRSYLHLSSPLIILETEFTPIRYLLLLLRRRSRSVQLPGLDQQRLQQRPILQGTLDSAQTGPKEAAQRFEIGRIRLGGLMVQRRPVKALIVDRIQQSAESCPLIRRQNSLIQFLVCLIFGYFRSSNLIGPSRMLSIAIPARLLHARLEPGMFTCFAPPVFLGP